MLTENLPITTEPHATRFVGTSRIGSTKRLAQTVSQGDILDLLEVTTSRPVEEFFGACPLQVTGAWELNVRRLTSYPSANWIFVCSQGPNVDVQEGATLSWLFDAMREGPGAEPAVEELTKYVDGVNVILKKRNFALLSFLLGSIDTNKVSSRTLITLARAIAPAGSHVPRWRTFLTDVASALTDRGKSADKLLKGLV